MKRKKILTTLMLIALANLCCYGQESSESEKIMVIREGLRLKRTTVAVEGYYNEGLIEFAVEARMYSERPRIQNVRIVGPGLGRKSYDLKKDIPLTLEKEEPYDITRKGDWLPGRFKTEKKKPKGTVTKELFIFKIPWKKINKNKKYELWVDVESKTSSIRAKKFKFKLNRLPELALLQE